MFIFAGSRASDQALGGHNYITVSCRGKQNLSSSMCKQAADFWWKKVSNKHQKQVCKESEWYVHSAHHLLRSLYLYSREITYNYYVFMKHN